MEPRIVTRHAAKIVGLAVRTTNQREAKPDTGRIPGLWRAFFTSGTTQRITNQKNPQNVFGVYPDYEKGDEGWYSLIAGVEVSSLNEVPAGMRSARIQAGRYLVFPVQGPMPKALIETWQSVWKYFAESSAHRRAYTADFELYETNSETQQSEVSIYVAVR